MFPFITKRNPSDICKAKWFPPLIRDPVNQANGVSRRERGLLVCRADASEVLWEIISSEPTLRTDAVSHLPEDNLQ